MPTLSLIVSVLLVSVGLVSTGSGSTVVRPDAAQRSGSYDNALIADLALARQGGWGGECRAFVGEIVKAASGGTQDIRTGRFGGDYFASLAAYGARITSLDDLRKGDIVQIGQAVHTYIIVSRVGGNVFNVVDSNHNYDKTVHAYQRAVTLNDQQRAYRLGTVKSAPPTEPDDDHDGIPNGRDGCPGVAGPAAMGGCPDRDGDQVRDGDDLCVDVVGLTYYRGCPEATAIQFADSQSDVNGDGRSDYCRRVGNQNNVDSRVQCTLTAAHGFGATWTSNVLDWGYGFGRAWVDVSGDGRADYCRRVGNVNLSDSRVQCTLATSSGFGTTWTSDVVDWGYDYGRAWVDFNGDRRADYCRVVGGPNHIGAHVMCMLAGTAGFGATVTSPALDWGYDIGRAWVDVNADSRADYCRRVGGANNVDSHLQCTLSAGSAFGATWTSGVVDWGYDYGHAWVDSDGDHRADYCRAVGVDNNKGSYLQCTLTTANGFGVTRTSGVLDWGYDLGRAWVDVSGDGRADYCRRVGNVNLSDSRVQCTLSTAAGFGKTRTSGVLDWGYDHGRAWVDANGDHRADYCRVVGVDNHHGSHVSCTLSDADGFAGSLTSDVLDWGYEDGRAWTSASDVRAPVVAVAAVRARGGRVSVAWRARDLDHPVASSAVRVRRGSGPWLLPARWRSVRGTQLVLRTTRPGRYCFQVQSRDVIGNVSGWTASRCTRLG